MKLLRSMAHAGVVGALMALGGCYEIASSVAVVTDATRAASLPTQPGRYCSAHVSFDEQGAIVGVEVEDCFNLAVDGGLFTATPDPPEEGPLTLEVAELTRGASLLQRPDTEAGGDGYLLLIAFLREDAVTILDEPLVTEAIAAAAEREGVTLADASSDAEIDIVEGAPDAALAFLRDAAGLFFDAALRDEAVAHELKDDAIYYVRVGDDAASADLDPAAVQEKVEALLAMIDRAMSLE